MVFSTVISTITVIVFAFFITRYVQLKKEYSSLYDTWRRQRRLMMEQTELISELTEQNKRLSSAVKVTKQGEA